MKIKELAEYCNAIGVDCEVCTHKMECARLSYVLEDISPSGLVELIKEDRELS